MIISLNPCFNGIRKYLINVLVIIMSIVVLILVLMEYENTKNKQYEKIHNYGLNPCFNGIRKYNRRAYNKNTYVLS